jgi:hypothetical protein
MFAQGGATGAIGGVVQDASGVVIANAKVSSPITTVGGAGSGGGSAPITSTLGTPRLIQFSLKYSF